MEIRNWNLERALRLVAFVRMFSHNMTCGLSTVELTDAESGAVAKGDQG